MKLISNLLSIIGIISIFAIPIQNPLRANAEITTNEDSTIEIEKVSINSNPPPKNQKKQTPQDPLRETNSGTNYKIKTGFEGLNPLESFSLSISNSLIDNGFISPTNPIYRTSNLTVSSNSVKTFIVVGYQNHPLATKDSNIQIPDSTCDNGSCSEITSSIWSNTLTYGFGFRCENITEEANCLSDMKESNYYKQFSDTTKNEQPQIIMTGKNNKKNNNQIQITYKINTSKTQAAGLYSNEITYIASPGY